MGPSYKIAMTSSEEARAADLVGRRRFERLRKRLPNLRLKYPDDNEILKLAALAGAKNHSDFSSSINGLIFDAHLNNESFSNLSAPKIRSTLQTIARCAHQLETALKGIDEGSGGSNQHAGLMLEIELAKLQRSGDFLLPEYISKLSQLGRAAQRSSGAVKSKRGPKGAGGNLAFDLFVEGLLSGERLGRGHWTIYRRADGTWAGSLIEALKTLQNYLPRNFFPPGDVGNAADHVRTKLHSYIAKN